MRILLVNAPVSRISPHSRLAPPLGVAYLAGHLRERGHEVHLLDLNVSGYSERRLELVLDRIRPELVGISAYTETYPNALLIARQSKRFDGAVPVVIGGAHPSILPAEVLSEEAVDYVVVGEGEETLAELAHALEAGEESACIRGLGWKRDGQPVLNERRPLLEADAVGLPARDLLSLEFYQDAFNVLTARGGCPYRCPFCSASHIWSGRHRPRAPKAVVDEIEMLVRTYGASFVFFVDDIFTLRRDWVVELMHELERLAGAITWGCGTRVDRVDEELLGLMASHGCTGIQFGVESGSQEILDSVKGIEKDAALHAVKWAVAAGITTTCSFMVPFPQDTPETLRETFDFMATLHAEGADLLMSYTTPYPGTLFYDQADELGVRILTKDWGEYDAKHLVMETRHLTVEQVEAIVAAEASRLGLSRSA